MILKNLILLIALMVLCGGCTSGLIRASSGAYSGGPTVASSDTLGVFYDYVSPDPPHEWKHFVGKLGHHLSLHPIANCGQGWRYSKSKIVTGKLPPGISFNNANIAGIPSHPGTWEMTIKFIGLSCGAVTHPDSSTVLKISIKGFPAESI